ncbi:hypothetical protein CLV33_106199 [Jejuia pallidilutea]|uniref:Uncharacterized protein n=1 Tax=Jejuia pallidilutea TaxID=504487 RepID=A0A362X2M4_9FLAO|nr:hypothetical protein CLV33_106199 [Jejuia pallidilutea]
MLLITTAHLSKKRDGLKYKSTARINLLIFEKFYRFFVILNEIEY